MYVNTLLTDAVSAGNLVTPATRAAKNREAGGTELPASWGSDVVTLSPEARAALSGAPRGGGEQTDTASGTREAFATYLKKARSQARDEEEGDELEKLRKKLKKLRERLARAMQDRSGSDNDGLAKALTSQITEVATQIAKLTAQALQASGK